MGVSVNANKISGVPIDNSPTEVGMAQKKKYFPAMDRSAEIVSHFNDAVSILGDLPIPELEISCVDDMNGAAGYCHYKDGIEVSNLASAHTIYHEMAHWVYFHSDLYSAISGNGEHDIVFACINAGFYSLVRPRIKDAFNSNGQYKNLPALYMMKIYDTYEEPDPIFRGAYGLLFVERFFKMLLSAPKYYASESAIPSICDIPMIAYMAKHLALGSVNPDPANLFVTPKNIDAAIETAMETCMLTKNSKTLDLHGKPLRPIITDTTNDITKDKKECKPDTRIVKYDN